MSANLPLIAKRNKIRPGKPFLRISDRTLSYNLLSKRGTIESNVGRKSRKSSNNLSTLHCQNPTSPPKNVQINI
jgi:hypothetical protein